MDPPIESETLESIENLEPETAEENSQDFLADEPTEFPSTLDDLDLSESDPDDEAPSKAWLKNLVNNSSSYFHFRLEYHICGISLLNIFQRIKYIFTVIFVWKV